MVAVEDLQRVAERRGGVHVALEHREDREVAPPGNAGDRALELAFAFDVLHDERAGLVRPVRVADVQGNAFFLDRQNGFLVQHRSAHERHLAQLGVGDAGNGPGILHNARIGHQYAGNVRPVFVYVRVHRGCGERAGDVAAAAGEGADLAVGRHAVKAGDDDAAPVGQALQRGIGRLLVDRPVELEAHPQLRVQKRVAEVVRHEQGGEIFAARHELLLRDAGAHLLAQHGELGLDVHVQAALVADGDVAIGDHLEDGVAAHAVLQVRVAQVQEVCELVVVRAALAGSGHDDHFPRGVGTHDVAHFFKLFGVRHRRAAEFCNFQHGALLTAARQRSSRCPAPAPAP